MNFDEVTWVIIEDELPAREALKEELSEVEGCNIIGEAASVEDGYQCIVKNRPEALFLDIKLEGGTAFQILRKLRSNRIPLPSIVLMTGFDDFELAQIAHNEFNESIVRILKKPFWAKWDEVFPVCLQGVLRMREERSLGNHYEKKTDHIFLRSELKTYRISPEDIDYVLVVGNGQSMVVIGDDRITISKSLSHFLRELPNDFMRIHRNYAVNRNKISYVDHDEQVLEIIGHGKALDIGPTYYQNVLKWIKGG